ncbi:uncharacterized protein [Drosophila takahashii]|uniref:uncharacterized protein n=1 Tax=Drosophila takahashii TaxID=29030 RepID=UPI001CF82A94|nr:uncharacterized protein LOC108056937 [Drosophila takahashii]
MRFGYIHLFQVVLILYSFTTISSKLEFTNIKCISHDPEFSDFEYCHLKSVNRSYKYLSVKVKLYKIPITKIKINFALFKRSNGYKPLLYNITADACRYLKNPKSNPVLTYMYGFFKAHSNMNHCCPFDHDLIVDKLTTDFFNTRLTELLPFPEGEILFKSHWFAYDILRASASIYFTLS